LPASAIIDSVWDPFDRYAMRVLIGEPFHPALPSARGASALISLFVGASGPSSC
jgi:hypothetical protein